jgi:hypothetical protein
MIKICSWLLSLFYSIVFLFLGISLLSMTAQAEAAGLSSSHSAGTSPQTTAVNNTTGMVDTASKYFNNKTVAVVTLKNQDGITRNQAKLVTDCIRSALLNTGAIDVIDQNSVEDGLKVQKYSKDNETTKMLKLGKYLKAGKVFCGTIGKIGTTVIATVKVYDVQQKRLRISRSTKDIDSIASLVNAITGDLGIESGIKLGSAPDTVQDSGTASSGFPELQPTGPETPKEAGQYARKSITYIDALLLLDQSVQNLSGTQVTKILDKIKSELFMPRFDYNPVPRSFVSDFIQQVNAADLTQPVRPLTTQPEDGTNAASDPMLESITAIMERTVVPKVLEVVDLNKESRANNLTSEQQRNSFITDKAKMLGITMDDIDKVMNSAYIFVPMIRNYNSALINDSTYSVSFDVGIIWFRIATNGERAHAIPIVRQFTRSAGIAKIGKNYPTEDGYLDWRDFAFHSAIKNAARNLVAITQDMPEFRLSGQILEKGFMNVSFDLGKKEGVKLDDKYNIVETSQDADGKTVEKKNGWILVTSVGDTTSKEGYKSKAQVISGSPYIGEVLSEKPLLPIDLIGKIRLFAFSVKEPDESWSKVRATDAFGFQVDAQYNIGRCMGINQLFFDFGFGLGWGGVSGQYGDGYDYLLSSVKAWEFSFVKKFYIGRCALVIQPLFGLQYVSLETEADDDDISYRAANSSSGFALNGGLEYALSPSCNFGVGVGYQMYGKSSTWDIDYRAGSSGSWTSDNTGVEAYNVKYAGITASIYFTWSLPSLGIDPLDAVRGYYGI